MKRKKSDKALGLTPVEIELTQKIQRQFPRGIEPVTLQAWNGLLADIFGQQLRSFFEKSPLKAEWQTFYQKYFDLKTDFSDVTVPADPGGFSRIIFIPQGLTIAQAVSAMRKAEIQVHLYNDDLDKEITWNVRNTDRDYSILVRNRQEADEELKNLSANQLKKQNVNCEGLLERLVHGFKYWTESEDHLDVKNVTLCAGSRVSSGGVPGVGWFPADRGVYVDWCRPGHAHGRLRARQAVSS